MTKEEIRNDLYHFIEKTYGSLDNETRKQIKKFVIEHDQATSKMQPEKKIEFLRGKLSYYSSKARQVEQTQRIINYQNQRNAGEINRNEQEKAIGFVQKLVRHLKHYEVINPYATKLNLPEKVHKIRRLNEMYQAVIKQVTFINQYQREIRDGYLITEIEDIEQATEVLFESIVLKVDELDGSLRQFYERLKKYVKNENQEFILREIRQEFNISKTQMFRYIQTLVELDYIKQTGGFANKGIKYKISYWDNHQKLRTEIKEFLQNQIRQLKNASETPQEHKRNAKKESMTA